MIRDGGINVLLPSGLAEAGEQIVFNHVTFADAPPPHRDSVWVQGGGQEVVFSDCSFDQAQCFRGTSGGQGQPFRKSQFWLAWLYDLRFRGCGQSPRQPAARDR